MRESSNVTEGWVWGEVAKTVSVGLHWCPLHHIRWWCPVCCHCSKNGAVLLLLSRKDLLEGISHLLFFQEKKVHTCTVLNTDQISVTCPPCLIQHCLSLSLCFSLLSNLSHFCNPFDCAPSFYRKVCRHTKNLRFIFFQKTLSLQSTVPSHLYRRHSTETDPSPCFWITLWLLLLFDSSFISVSVHDVFNTKESSGKMQK